MSVINGLEVYKVLRKIKLNIEIIKMATFRQGIEDLIPVDGNVVLFSKHFDLQRSE